MSIVTPESPEKVDGSVYFHLAEQKQNNEFPFAFMASYNIKNGATFSTHVPLGQMLQQRNTSGDKRSLLLIMLEPIQKAATESPFLSGCIESGEIFRPTALTAQRAYLFLKDTPLFEQAGITVRVPNWWQPKQPSKPTVQIKIGNQASLVGLSALLDFSMQVTLPDGTELSTEEIITLLNAQSSLVRVRGQWLQLDDTKLQQVLSFWKKKSRQGLTLAESLRTLAGMPDTGESEELAETIRAWSTVIEGKQLKEILNGIRNPDISGEDALKAILADRLQAQLRPYQIHGVQWLWTLYQLKLGGCLADDMGLGKTIQIISLLLIIQQHVPTMKHLLVLPASLLGNWSAEIKRFAPSLRILILHSAAQAVDVQKAPDLTNIDLVITTYGFTHRLEFLQKIVWDLVIIDEAQAIKNPGSKQTKAVKQLQASVKIALTGTPIENNLLDLWSLFDFCAHGLLGSSKQFAKKIKTGDPDTEKINQTIIQRLVSPYILRRLKSDKRVVNDLPDKTEMAAYCNLTKTQATLYQNTVDELADILKQDNLEGIQRKGIVLSYLMRLKQICNHPNQTLGHVQYKAEDSGKFARLHELCMLIAEKKEKVLIFTQFREIIPTIASFLETIFGKPGIMLHGDTPVKKRAELVAAFQQKNGPPFFVLSLKAGGTGLNLTNASHVIHFDRWWNPAVEDQATDRAYRIGQKKNVLVHKFICCGTIEEKIDELITRKRSLVHTIIKSEQEVNLSELSNAEILDVVSLDINRALEG